MEISNDGLEARKVGFIGFGVVYSERPVRGHVEFELEYGASSDGSITLGVMLHRSWISLWEVAPPLYTPAENHCVWLSKAVYYGHTITREEMPYGNLDELRKGDRVGLLITSDGELHFLVNGEPQGRATCDIYRPGYDVYIAVDHYGDCAATRITKASKPVLLSMPYFLALALDCFGLPQVMSALGRYHIMPKT